MMEQIFIPTLDPEPLPAPYWIFKLLLNITFILHIVAMNLLLGSGLLALYAKFQSRKNEYASRIFNELARILPVLLPATITLGVAPLLFVQVLYGQFFYTSSIIMGWPWFFVLVFLTIAYYGFYYVSFKKFGQPARALWAAAVSLFLTLTIGFIYTNNITLSMTPENWRTKYFADLSGWNWNLGEPTLVPRFLHFLFAALAIGGLFVVFRGVLRKKEEPEYAHHMIRFGGKAFMYATMVQIVVGIWFLMALPRVQRMLFMGDSPQATILMTLGIIGAIAGILAISNALHNPESNAGLYLGMGLTLLTIIFMAISRDMLRDSYLEPYLESMPVQTQWEVFPLFLLVFLGGLIFWFLMLKRYGFSGAATANPAEADIAQKS
jgi:hypothetical protein